MPGARLKTRIRNLIFRYKPEFFILIKKKAFSINGIRMTSLRNLVDSLPESEEINAASLENQPTKLELDLFFDYSLDLLVLVGFDNCFKQVSPSFERILGWTKEEVISKSFYKISSSRRHSKNPD